MMKGKGSYNNKNNGTGQHPTPTMKWQMTMMMVTRTVVMKTKPDQARPEDDQGTRNGTA